ncbi:AAA family ATPase [Vibrio parahaemolyticus]
MKLIYLYIEEYKVIKKRDITLCSQFKVTREELNFHISKSKIKEDFFTEGLDIVALFGQNASGKSTTLELITHILSGSFPEFCEFFAFYEKAGCIYSFTNISSSCEITSSDLHVIPIFKSDLIMESQNVIYFSHQVEPLAKKSNFKNNECFSYTDCSNQARLSRLKTKQFSNNQIRLCFRLLEHFNLGEYGIGNVPMIGASYPVQEVMWYLKKISNYLFDMSQALEALIEEYDLEKSLDKIIDKYRFELSRTDNQRSVISSNNLKNIFSNQLFKLVSRDLISKSNRYLDLLLMLELFLDVAHSILEGYKIKNEDLHLSNFYSPTVYECHIEILSIYLSIISGEAKVVDQHDFREIIKNHNLSFCLSDYDNSDEAYEMFQISNFIQRSFKNNEEGSFNIENYDSFEYINEFMNKGLRIFKNFELKWNGISSGQYSLLTMYSRLFEQCEKGVDLLIFIDEGESNLHPEWQRVYIKELVNFFSKVKHQEQVLQVIITSHSPFVLSDLPSESINILDERCVDSSFFGANIFQIYNKGFLLERTVGQFSYEKISSAIQELRTNGEDDDTRNIIDMIGDQVVKKLIKGIE